MSFFDLLKASHTCGGDRVEHLGFPFMQVVARCYLVRCGLGGLIFIVTSVIDLETDRLERGCPWGTLHWLGYSNLDFKLFGRPGMMLRFHISLIIIV